MFPHRLSEVTADEIRALIENEIAEGLDFELKATLPTRKGDDDPWLNGGKVGDEARNDLTAEINAFANTVGGTLVLGIGEDSETKRAILPIRPLRDCKALAERLHQAIGDRIEPKLPAFECAGVVTEADGTSGVVVMRTLESYVAPHRHTQTYHCYVRRNDRAEPMSMLEIQELTRRKARSLDVIERDFSSSADRFFEWIPQNHQRTHPQKGTTGFHTTENSQNIWRGLWAIRVTARPLAALSVPSLPSQPWLADIKLEPYTLIERSGQLQCPDIELIRRWQPRLRAVEREFKGDYTTGLDRIGTDGAVERFVRATYARQLPRPERYPLSASEIVWNLASVMHTAEIVRTRSSRPNQAFGIEVEFFPSDPIQLIGYPGLVQSGGRNIPNQGVLFPRYEMRERETLNETLATFDLDLWHLAGLDPHYTVGIKWPPNS
jgi:hypothetical protein